jgi:hypothetical protein
MGTGIALRLLARERIDLDFDLVSNHGFKRGHIKGAAFDPRRCHEYLRASAPL